MTRQPSSSTDSFRPGMSIQRLAGHRNIERARNPRSALRRLLPYLSPFRAAMTLVLAARAGLQRPGPGRAIPDGRGD